MTLSLLGISNDELDALKNELGAVLDIYRGKVSSGSEIDALELTKAQTCIDLSLAADFDDYVENERYGEEIAAFVIAREGVRFDVESVREFCQGKIAHYKIPRYVIRVDAFPLTVTGKIQKFKLRERGIALLGLEPALVETT
jgi:acyl-CoA synthetase (AMP-forming)/AMP-acid ligase II